MDIIFTGKGMLFLDALLALVLFVAVQGQFKILFSVQGRIKRMTFWEGLMAWFLLNLLGLVVGIAHAGIGYDDQLAENFGDLDHTWYHRLVMVAMLTGWLLSAWIMIVLCAKRWHDLNFSGWFALINALPMLTFGYAAFILFDSVGPQMNRVFAIKNTTLELSQMVAASAPSSLTGWPALSVVLSVGLLVALGAYLGFAKGDSGANPYGKASV